MGRLGALVVAGALTWSSAGLAQQPVELELVLAIDASGSVDAQEFDLQLRGIAAALQDPEVGAAIAATNGVAVSVVQWAGPSHQVQAIDWALLTDGPSAAAHGATILAGGRQMFGETAIAQALQFAATLMDRNAYAGQRRTIDVSGDGATNYGRSPGYMRDRLVAAGITVNGLAILNENPDLESYYVEHVIGGPGAFVMVATDYVDFAEAFRRKLIQEILGGPIATQPSTGPIKLVQAR